MHSSGNDLREWLFRAMMFEADVERFRIAGIRIGADQTDVEASLMNEVLAPFPVDLRNRAMRMTRLYALIHCFENSVRQLVKERLELKFKVTGGKRACLRRFAITRTTGW